MPIRSKRRREYDRVVKQLRNRTARITAGIHAADGARNHSEGTSVIEIANIHEFGSRNIPERSFVRAWYDQNLVRAKAQLRRELLDSLNQTGSTQRGLQRFALWVEADIVRRINEGISPANAESTVQRKGSSTPLIDTGVLKSSIKAVVKLISERL